MTKQEKIIVSAYTGVLMCDFDDLHEYIQKKFGRPVFTHELADEGIQKEVEEKSKEEFLGICNREEPEWNNQTVACLLAELFDDTCACNYNDIDEWLPEKCELLDSCPNPGGVACWEQFLKHKAERRTDGTD